MFLNVGSFLVFCLEYFLSIPVTSNLLKIEKGVLIKQGGWKICLGMNNWWVEKGGDCLLGGMLEISAASK